MFVGNAAPATLLRRRPAHRPQPSAGGKHTSQLGAEYPLRAHATARDAHVARGTTEATRPLGAARRLDTRTLPRAGAVDPQRGRCEHPPRGELVRERNRMLAPLRRK